MFTYFTQSELSPKTSYQALKCHRCTTERDALHCRLCHSSKCFAHILDTFKMHSSDALVAHARCPDKDHYKYHQQHQLASTSYQESFSLIRDCQRAGTAPPEALAPIMRTEIALTHRRCRPVIYSHSTPGFYDEFIQDCDDRQEVLDSLFTEKDATDMSRQSDTESSSNESEADLCPVEHTPPPSRKASRGPSQFQKPSNLSREPNQDEQRRDARVKPVWYKLDYVAVPELRIKPKVAASVVSGDNEVITGSSFNSSGPVSSVSKAPEAATAEAKGKGKEVFQPGSSSKSQKRKRQDVFPTDLADALNRAIANNGTDEPTGPNPPSGSRSRVLKRRKTIEPLFTPSSEDELSQATPGDEHSSDQDELLLLPVRSSWQLLS